MRRVIAIAASVFVVFGLMSGCSRPPVLDEVLEARIEAGTASAKSDSLFRYAQEEIKFHNEKMALMRNYKQARRLIAMAQAAIDERPRMDGARAGLPAAEKESRRDEPRAVIEFCPYCGHRLPRGR